MLLHRFVTLLALLGLLPSAAPAQTPAAPPADLDRYVAQVMGRPPISITTSRTCCSNPSGDEFPPRGAPQPSESAFTGSIRAARRAGRYADTSAARASPVATAV